MTVPDIIDCFISWGKFVKTTELYSFSRYIKEMLRRNRVILIEKDGRIEAIICYFITDDVCKFDNRPLWSCPEDLENGPIIFIDKMVARAWTRHLRIAVREALESKYPDAEKAVWLREPKNRHVIINKRRPNELYSQVCG